MPKIVAPYCPHPLCHSRMVRGYTRNKDKQFIPHHWICPVCGNVIIPKEKDTAPLCE